MFLITLRVGGRYSNYREFKIFSNINYSDMIYAYGTGTKILGFDFIDCVYNGIYTNWFLDEHIDRLIECGVNSKYKKISKNCCIDHETFSEIYLFIVKLGNPDFNYSYCGSVHPTLYIGGLGLS